MNLPSARTHFEAIASETPEGQSYVIDKGFIPYERVMHPATEIPYRKDGWLRIRDFSPVASVEITHDEVRKPHVLGCIGVTIETVELAYLSSKRNIRREMRGAMPHPNAVIFRGNLDEEGREDIKIAGIHLLGRQGSGLLRIVGEKESGFFRRWIFPATETDN